MTNVLSGRMKEVGIEIFGERADAEPPRRFRMSVHKLLAMTRINSYWLLTGQGEKYDKRVEEQRHGAIAF